jgi:cyclophilin family peptidyl-prolyl cis-trans isomerase
MWGFIRFRRDLTKLPATRTTSSQGRRSSRQIHPEPLEDRVLMTASLQPISSLFVPALQGYTLPLEGSGTTDAQTFTVTSSNPDIAASIAPQSFWTLGVSYTDPTFSANSFTGTLTFNLFPNLTPNTVAQITNLTDNNEYTDTYKYVSRLATGFPNATGYLVQGGSPTLTGQNTPAAPDFANEIVQQLAFTGTAQLAMANSGGTDSNSNQFFVTTGSPNFERGYNFTIFGQLVSGQTTLAKMTRIPVMTNSYTGETSQPVNPLTITSAAITTTNPDGTVILDTTQATAGETASITVTATDSVDHTTASQSFQVTVGSYNGPFSPPINFKPYAKPTTASGPEDTAERVQLAGQNTFPDNSDAVPLTYSFATQPAHGTISNFNASTGNFIYTPAAGFVGTDTFKYNVEATGPNSTAAPAISNAGTVTISMTLTPPPLVTLSKVELVENHKQQVVQVIVFFSGPLDTTEADSKTIYRLATPGRHGSYTARNAGIIHVRMAVYSAAGDSVTLKPTARFSLKKPVQLLIHGTAPAGLQDSLGRYIDGADNGHPGSDAIAILSGNGVVL